MKLVPSPTLKAGQISWIVWGAWCARRFGKLDDRKVRGSIPSLSAMEGVAEWLRRWIVAPVTRVRSPSLSLISGLGRAL